MKKIMMVNGSPRKSGGTSAAFRALKAGMEEAGAQITEYRLNDLSFQGCQGCMACKQTGCCVLKDDLTEVLENLKTADALVLESPIYMFAVSGQTSLFLNRLYSLIDGSYQPYAGKMRRYASVYSMGSPSADCASAEADRVRQAMHMLGFEETDRITITGVFPGMHTCELSEPEFRRLKEHGMKFAHIV